MGSAMPRVAPLLSQVASKVPDLPLPDLPTIGGKSLGSGLITDIGKMPAGLGNYPGLISNLGAFPGYRPGLGGLPLNLNGGLPLRSLNLGGLNIPEIPETSRLAEETVGLIPLNFD
jgi:hypothetical protein